MGARIGLDVTAAATQTAGIGRYVRELTSALCVRDDGFRYRAFYCTGGAAHGQPPHGGPRLRVRRIPISDRYLNAIWYRARLPVPVQVLTGPIDLFHSPDFSLPPAPGTPTVLTIHDLAFLTAPECAYPTLRDYLARVVPRSAKRASHVIAVSESTRADVVRLLEIPESRVTTIHEGVSPRFRRQSSGEFFPVLVSMGISGPYLLTVGTLEPRKNLVRLIQAYAHLHHQGLEHKLIIAGRPGWLYDPIFAAVRACRVDSSVHFVQPTDTELMALFNGASVFVYPSLYEGFGIPVLEALACGVPVVCSGSSSLPEVAGNAALFFDPLEVEAISDAISTVINDAALAATLRQGGPARAAHFSWERAAEQTTRVYRETIARHG